MGHQHHVVSTIIEKSARERRELAAAFSSDLHDIFKGLFSKRKTPGEIGNGEKDICMSYTGFAIHSGIRPIHRRVNRHVVSHTVHARQSVSGHWSERQRGATDTRTSACVCGTGRVGRLERVTYADRGVPHRHLGLCWPAACLQVRLRVRSGRHKRARRASSRRLLRGQQLLSPQLGLLARARFGGYLRGGG